MQLLQIPFFPLEKKKPKIAFAKPIFAKPIFAIHMQENPVSLFFMYSSLFQKVPYSVHLFKLLWPSSLLSVCISMFCPGSTQNHGSGRIAALQHNLPFPSISSPESLSNPCNFLPHRKINPGRTLNF